MESMKIETASPEQAAAVKSILVKQMAEKLAAECFDLADDGAVIGILAGAFGSAATAELWEPARELARTLQKQKVGH
jgi:hypothetical protein